MMNGWLTGYRCETLPIPQTLGSNFRVAPVPPSSEETASNQPAATAWPPRPRLLGNGWPLPCVMNRVSRHCDVWLLVVTGGTPRTLLLVCRAWLWAGRGTVELSQIRADTQRPLPEQLARLWRSRGEIKGWWEQLQMGLGLQNKDDEEQARLWSFTGDWLSKFWGHYRATGIRLLTRRQHSLTSLLIWRGIKTKVRTENTPEPS